MSRGSKILMAFCLLVVAATVYLIWLRPSWDEKYQKDGKEPYDVDIIHDLILDKFGNKNSYEYLAASDSGIGQFINKGFTYVFIGNILHLDSAGESDLLQFVAQGNTAFIASNRTSHLFSNFSLTKNPLGSSSNKQFKFFDYDDTTHLHIKLPDSNDSLHFPMVYQDIIISYPFKYLNNDLDLNENVSLLGHFNKNRTNFFSFKYGRGIFYFYTTPLTLTNYSLSKEENLAYADYLFSFIDPQNGIFWDEYNKNTHYNDKEIEYEQKEQSPLRYILAQPGLRFAWYLSLGLLILYIIFIGKRRQRPIPVLEKSQNASLQFIQTVGKLYYAERDHRNICIHKMKLFHNFLRSRYGINVNTINNQLQDKIAAISGVSPNEIKSIYTSYLFIEKQVELSDDDLIQFNSAINNFYKKCK
jgi:hypothetical protein